MGDLESFIQKTRLPMEDFAKFWSIYRACSMLDERGWQVCIHFCRALFVHPSMALTQLLCIFPASLQIYLPCCVREGGLP